MNNNELNKYIGKEYNDKTIMEMNKKFAPYVVSLCTCDSFYLENYWHNQIRCVVENNIITNLQFN